MNGLIYSLYIAWEWEIHFGSKSICLPWWTVAIPSALILIIPIIIIARAYSKKKFVCPECNKAFHPKTRNALLLIHMNDDVYFKCPHCKKRTMCHPSYKQD